MSNTTAPTKTQHKQAATLGLEVAEDTTREALDVTIAEAAADAAKGLAEALASTTPPPPFAPPAVDQDAGLESNNVNDDVPPDAGPEPFNASDPQIGQFVGFGTEQVSVMAGEWLVDPATGCITGPI